MIKVVICGNDDNDGNVDNTMLRWWHGDKDNHGDSGDSDD